MNKTKQILERVAPRKLARRVLLETAQTHSDDDYHKSASEGEGACSKTSAGRSHLPLRGKLGWMTPRPGQKKTGKRNASIGGSCSQAGAPTYVAEQITDFRNTSVSIAATDFSSPLSKSK